MKILDEILNLSSKMLMCDQKQKDLEIEDFINYNLVEMHKSIDVLKKSLKNEAKLMEGKNFLFFR